MKIKVGIITYNHPHRKTQDLLFGLKARGIEPVVVYGVEWKDRKNHQPLFPHRPQNCLNIHPKEMCYNFGMTYTQTNLDYFISESERVLIGGVGILPDDVVKCEKIINSHPGYLPNSRGLDAMKWAIYNGTPTGVTTHVISSEIDLGWKLERKIVSANYLEDFYHFAMRIYETEIQMLLDSVGFDLSKKQAFSDLYTKTKLDIYSVTKRMGLKDELKMMKKFKEAQCH